MLPQIVIQYTAGRHKTHYDRILIFTNPVPKTINIFFRSPSNNIMLRFANMVLELHFYDQSIKKVPQISITRDSPFAVL